MAHTLTITYPIGRPRIGIHQTPEDSHDVLKGWAHDRDLVVHHTDPPHGAGVLIDATGRQRATWTIRPTEGTTK